MSGISLSSIRLLSVGFGRVDLGGSRLGLVAIETLAHFLAGLEERHALLIDWHMLAGTRIAAGARRAMLHRECAETAQLDTVATRQRRDDFIENRIHNILDIPLIEVRVVLGDTLNKFGFDHRKWDPGSCGNPFP
ncbi:hypothetical protein ACVMB0_001735 [Bradyrhizobium sp. USDA 4451]